MPNLLRLAAWLAGLVGLALLIHWLLRSGLFWVGYFTR